MARGIDHLRCAWEAAPARRHQNAHPPRASTEESRRRPNVAPHGNARKYRLYTGVSWPASAAQRRSELRTLHGHANAEGGSDSASRLGRAIPHTPKQQGEAPHQGAAPAPPISRATPSSAAHERAQSTAEQRSGRHCHTRARKAQGARRPGSQAHETLGPTERDHRPAHARQAGTPTPIAPPRQGSNTG